LTRSDLGVLFLQAGWAKVSNAHGVFGPIHAIVEFGGGILLLAGLLMRLAGLLLAADMLGASFLVKIHTRTFISQESLAFWISLALLAAGAGAISFDASVRGRETPGTMQRGGGVMRATRRWRNA
jgi:putative oxidoreductase